MPRSKIYKSAGFLRKEWEKNFRRIKKDPVALEIWAKKARSSKPKRSPRNSLGGWKTMAHRRKEERDKVTISNSKRHQLKQNDGEASSSSKPPDSKRLISGILTGNPVISCSKEKTVPISPPNLVSPRNIGTTNSLSSSTEPSPSKVLEYVSRLPNVNLKKSVCFRWRKGRCRNGNSCPYRHWVKNDTEKKQRCGRSPKARDREKSVGVANHLDPCEAWTEVCYWWLKGKCSRGNGCRFRHSRDKSNDELAFSANKSTDAGCSDIKSPTWADVARSTVARVKPNEKGTERSNFVFPGSGLSSDHKDDVLKSPEGQANTKHKRTGVRVFSPRFYPLHQRDQILRSRRSKCSLTRLSLIEFLL